MSDLVTLEGLHALKHAVRFGAEVTELVTDDLGRVLDTADQVAPDLRPLLEQRASVIAQARFREMTRQPVHTHLLARATRPTWTLGQAMPSAEHPTILLDDPRNSKNLGAVVRVGAAAGAAGLLVNGEVDVCDPMAVRGAAGLQWALPFWASPTLLAELDEVRASVDETLINVPISSHAARSRSIHACRGEYEFSDSAHSDDDQRILTGVLTRHNAALVRHESTQGGGAQWGRTQLVGLDADGEPLDPTIPGPIIFAFGSERTGLSEAVRTRCDAICSLPMTPHVSSLNLATAVSAVLYVTRFARARAAASGASIKTRSTYS